MAYDQDASKVKHIAYASVKTRSLSFDSAPKRLKKLKDKLASAGHFYQGLACLDSSTKYSQGREPQLSVRYPAYKNLKTRILSYNGAPHSLQKMAKQLSAMGSFYEGYNTKTSCYACGAEHDEWSEWDDPVEKHLKDNPNCSHVLMLKHQSELRKQSEIPKHEIPQTVSTARNPEYSSLALRTASFNEAGGYLKENASQIARSGLYYKGYGDKVQCHHCGTEMSITAHDDPTEKHSRLSQDCEFLRREIQSLNEDVDKIRNQLLCKVCLDAQVMVIFRPCGHLATCQACADQLVNCPICRTAIAERVKTYF